MQRLHIVQIVFSSLAIGLPTAAVAYPEAAKPALLAIAATCSLIAGVLGAVTGSMLAKKDVAS